MASGWLQHTLSRKRFQKRNQAATLAILGISILLLLGSLYLSQVASFAITNREIEELIIERDELKYRNEQLRAEIAQYRTVPQLTIRAIDIGFRPATNDDIDYVVIAGYSPAPKRTFASTAWEDQSNDAAARYDETFSGWLEAQMAGLRDQFDAFRR